MMERSPCCAIVVFGVTGDLAARKLIPALYALHVDGRLHPEAVIVGYARSDLGDDALRVRLGEALREHHGGVDDEAWDALARRIHYVRGGYDERDGYERLARRLDELGRADHIHYTSTPPETYRAIVAGLASAGLNRRDDVPGRDGGFPRLVIEKPFGHDLASARELNDCVLRHFDESRVFRIDHYLAKETAQNLAVLRFGNAIFDPVWSSRYIDHVQITMAESIGIEGRGAFYEASGVVRDVFQNHVLQLLALVAMEPPSSFGDANAVRDEKAKVLRALACLAPEDTVLGQYVAGDDLPGYRQEDGVAPDSDTPTFAAAVFELRTWRWAGVPFYLRSGKRLASKASEIVLAFKTPPHVPFDLDAPLAGDRLVLRLVPDEGISLRFNAKRPGQGIDVGRVSLDFAYGGQFARRLPDAYETLLFDVLAGDATLFMRADEVEAQWRAVAPLLDDAARAPVPYRAGTDGPPEADALLERHGRAWRRAGSD
jgi:glucose-6-phosphate 1-dehydrogenase